MTIYEKLLHIQEELKAPKSKFNKFGNFNYRSCEDILEAVKPLCVKYKTLLLISEDVVYVEGRHYFKATATLLNVEDKDAVTVSAMVREADKKTGMDDAQLSGATSSYAKKRTLSDMFAIDDTDDVDGESSAEGAQKLPAPQKSSGGKDSAKAKNAAQSEQTKPVPDNKENIAVIKAKIAACKERTGRTQKSIAELIQKQYDINDPGDFKKIIKLIDTLEPLGEDPFDFDDVPV